MTSPEEAQDGERHDIESVPLAERAHAYESALEQLKQQIDEADTELDFGA